MSERIGIVGLGRMGSAMAKRFAAQGRAAYGWTRSGVAEDQANAMGLESCATLTELAEQSDIILLSLFDDAAVTNILDQLFECDLAGKLITDTSTVAPELLRARTDAAASAGTTLLDAPISGGPELILAGAAGVFVGGDDAGFARVKPVLELISNRIHHVGALGTGLSMKIVNNGLLQGMWATLVDVVKIAKRSGLSLETTVTILAGSPAANPMMVARVPKILGDDESVGFDINGAVKDAEVFLDAAQGLDLDTPILSEARRMWTPSLNAGDGELDVAAIIAKAYADA